MTDERRRRRRRRPLFGRHPMTLGALALAGISGYELWVRLEDFWAWTAGIRHLSQVRGTPFLQDLGIVFEAPEMRQLAFKLLFLLACVLFGVVCLFRRNKARGAWVLFALAAALAGAGLALGVYAVSSWTQLVKLVPLALIAIGCVSNRAQRRARRARRRRAKSPQ